MLKKNSKNDSALEKFNLTKYYYNSNCPYLFIFPLLILNLLYSWWVFCLYIKVLQTLFRHSPRHPKSYKTIDECAVLLYYSKLCIPIF